MSSNTKQPRHAASLQIFADSMMQDDSLPLSDVIGNQLFEEAFETFGVQFGAEDDAADTPENQAEYPQNPAQKDGLGFPMLRCVCLTSLATGLMIDLAIGPYAGKGSGETALLRQLFEDLKPGDNLVADSYHCTYWLIAYCRKHGIELVMKNHHKRDDHPEDATRI